MRARKSSKLPVAMRLGVTPVPIPNTMVKTQAADGTILETVWKSRWLPKHKKVNNDDRRAAEFDFLGRSPNEIRRTSSAGL